MMSKEEQVRSAIAEQAAAWLVANDEGLNARESAALTAWLKASPVHVEEFLRASVVARDLREARNAPEYAIDALLASVRAEVATPVRSLWPRLATSAAGVSRGWISATVGLAAIAVLAFGLFSVWKPSHPIPPVTFSAMGTPTLHFETRHGEQLTRRLADNSVLHLNTDSAVTVRFTATERLVMLTSGQAEFEVSHDAARAFRVLGGTAEIVAIGTQFDVQLTGDATVVTVVEGRVAVGLSPALEKRSNPGPNGVPRYVEVAADQQLQVTEAGWPAAPVAVQAEHATSWLRREIVFDHEPLEQVVAEFNRYAAKPLLIATPGLGKLEISGSFATDDTDAFVAFLRTLKGLRIEVTATNIQVFQK